MRLAKLHHVAFLGLCLGALSSLPLVSSAYASPPHQGYAPDPVAIASQKQWIFRIEVKAGKLSHGAIRIKNVDKAEPTRRMMGRYAFELWVGKELLDRIRFNIPGAGDGPPRDEKRILKRPQMDRINTRFTVRLADNPRATFAKFVDRATGDEWVMAWPPTDLESGFASAKLIAPPADPSAASADGKGAKAEPSHAATSAPSVVSPTPPTAPSVAPVRVAPPVAPTPPIAPSSAPSSPVATPLRKQLPPPLLPTRPTN